MTELDRRRHAYRTDLAAESLAGRVEAARFVKGTPAQVAAGLLDLRREPRPDAPLDSQLLAGETVTLFDQKDGWAWVQNGTDGYVGYVPSAGLSRRVVPATHQVAVLRTFVYPKPDLKAPPLDVLSMTGRVAVIDEENRFSRVGRDNADGEAGEAWVYSRHLVPLDDKAPDYVATALQFLGLPYLWGGRGSLGLDCSALLQIPLARAGIPCPRDSDMQAAELGLPVQTDLDAPELRRGDFIFWPGHVAIALERDKVVHAHADAMLVTTETVAPITERVKAESGGRGVLAVRRL